VRRFALILLALTVAVALPACGGGEDESATPETVEGTTPQDTGDTGDTGDGAGEGNAENGASVFASAGCGGCHTLSDAGSSGTIGPDLDDSQVAKDPQAVAEKVRAGGGGMPAFEGRLSDQEIQDVAAYVSSASGG
jgi:mono/diheme cytochrome c family protein